MSPASRTTGNSRLSPAFPEPCAYSPSALIGCRTVKRYIISCNSSGASRQWEIAISSGVLSDAPLDCRRRCKQVLIAAPGCHDHQAAWSTARLMHRQRNGAKIKEIAGEGVLEAEKIYARVFFIARQRCNGRRHIRRGRHEKAVEPAEQPFHPRYQFARSSSGSRDIHTPECFEPLTIRLPTRGS